MRQQHRGDAGVVVDHLALGEAGLAGRAPCPGWSASTAGRRRPPSPVQPSAHRLDRSLVGPHAAQHRVPQSPVVGPGHELHLDDHRRLHPVHPAPARRGERLGPAAGSPGVQPVRREPRGPARRSTRCPPCRRSQSALLVSTAEACSELSSSGRSAAALPTHDRELTGCTNRSLAQSAAADSRPVARSHPLGDHAFQPVLTGGGLGGRASSKDGLRSSRRSPPSAPGRPPFA